jgi:hypothetical protein
MTYSPGSPGYPPAQSPGSYGGSTPSFAKSDDTASKLPLYLTIAVIALGLAAYVASFFPMFTVSAEVNPGGVELSGDGGSAVAVTAALLAALLAAVGLLPKAKNYTAIVAVIAVLGALLVIAQTLSGHMGMSIGPGLWFVLVCSVAQAAVAAAALLLEAGVRLPAPRPKYNQYSQYAQYGQYTPQPGAYYGQPGGQQHAPLQQHGPPQSPQPSAYGVYGGYASAPSTGGFSTVGAQTGAQQVPQQGPQQGPPTPPTGFPSFSQPPSVGSDADSQGPGNSGNHSSSDQGQQSYGQGQQQTPSSPSGPTQS